ncbi:FecCD family ABC transporter permease [Brachybacterium saurashtrense]|uniref:Iron ABC transporter permease n=1 Tax=Brachybacterium saurashtrense TaxID=556288 RepID=A0A345YQ50_9MICO|nr:iron ABC transporter permease [Brachybacterium saurashtrense]AXK46052.1 iron ABC transporter permease [Brachybacterium saurashtrense]RRR23792.1 iron ABC transporter permease [Brachybacterium saurashtrense]
MAVIVPTPLRPAVDSDGVTPRTPLTGRRRFAIVLAVTGTIVTALVVLSSLVGVRMLAPDDLWRALTAFDARDDAHLLLVNRRLPRAALAVLVGAALGAAGVVMQSLTRNPIAEPGLLGVNAGAAVAVAVAVALAGIVTPFAYFGAALLGAAAAGALVILLGGVRRGSDPVRLVLAGAALSVVLGALAQIVIINGDEQIFDRYRAWAVGSLAGRDLDVLPPAAVLLSLGLVLASLLCRALDATALGPEASRALGARPALVWPTAGLAVVLLAGGATASAGPIAFVGLTAPHVARLLVGSAHHRMLPVAMALGATLVLVADTLGRVVAPPGEVGVGIMVALLGGPFFVALVRRRRVAPL